MCLNNLGAVPGEFLCLGLARDGWEDLKDLGN